jgi:hypothetical protein
MFCYSEMIRYCKCCLWTTDVTFRQEYDFSLRHHLQTDSGVHKINTTVKADGVSRPKTCGVLGPLVYAFMVGRQKLIHDTNI